EVDLFLDEVVDEFEAMQKEIKALHEVPAISTPRAMAPAPQQIAKPSGDEESVRMMLVNAQRICDETIAAAKARAEEIERQANEQAEHVVSDAREEAAQLRENMDNLRGAANDYRARFQRLVEDQMHILNGETELFR
ncbi:MAG: DivIVA domain-containing protein, partial [Clostridia bacterium]